MPLLNIFDSIPSYLWVELGVTVAAVLLIMKFKHFDTAGLAMMITTGSFIAIAIVGGHMFTSFADHLLGVYHGDTHQLKIMVHNALYMAWGGALMHFKHIF